MKRIIALLALAVVGLAQDGKEVTDAERTFREAWWQETGANALDTALSLYKQAANAEGPAKVRARAWLKVAEIQKRLGDTEQALKTLETLESTFGDEKEIVTQARALAAELTAVNLRQSYSEWYRRYLFSPEYQVKVVKLVQDLGGDVGKQAAQRQLLAIGDAAVPALQQVVSSRNEELATRAARILLQLGVPPPAAVLTRDLGWIEDPAAWKGILTADRDASAHLRKLAESGSSVQRALRAAATSPSALVGVLGSDAGAELHRISESLTYPVLTAVCEVGDATVLAEVAALAVSRETSLKVRLDAENFVVEHGLRGMDARKWLAWAKQALRWEVKTNTMRHIGRSLRAGDGETFDALLGFFGEVGSHELTGQLVESFTEGLEENGLILQLPWTAARIRTCMELATVLGLNGLARCLGVLRVDPEQRRRVADAILVRPGELAQLFARENSCLGEMREADLAEEVQSFLLERHWARDVVEIASRKWQSWPPEHRLGFLHLLREHDLVVWDEAEPIAVLQDFLADRMKTATPAEKLLLEKLVGGG